MPTRSRSERIRLATRAESMRPAGCSDRDWALACRIVHAAIGCTHTPGVTLHDKVSQQVAVSMSAWHERHTGACHTHEDLILAYLDDKGARSEATSVRARDVALHCSPHTMRPSTPYAIMSDLVAQGVVRRTYSRSYRVWLP